MKHLTDSTADRLTVVELFVFDPWPFERDELLTNLPAIEHGVKSHEHGWYLADKAYFSGWRPNAIAVLSDGTRCVTDPVANPVGTVVTR